MNHAKKIATGAALLLAVAGGLALAAAGASGDVELGNGKGLSCEMKTYEVEEAFSDIRIEDAECSVRILPAADGACRVVCPEKRDGSVYHTVAVSGGELRVQRHDRRRWYQYIGVSLGDGEMEVYLPEGEYGKLAFLSTSGSIRVDGGFRFESARLESTSGDVQMSSEVKEALTAQSTSGSVCVETAAPEALTAETVSGSIALSHVRCGEISVKSTSGRIGLTDAIAEAGLRVKSVSGSIALEDCDGGDVRIQTTSGSVEGTLLSDKLFVADSTSGSINVPLSRGAEKCEITTVSGSIAIEIGR